MSDEWIERHRRFYAATIAGDLAGMRAAVENPADFPNSPTTTECGEYPLICALVDGPLETVRELLMLGADPNIDPGAGDLPLHIALESSKEDRIARVELLLAFGSDPQQRGTNDFTPLHKAACLDDAEAIELLLAHGADPELRTRVDYYETPLELAQRDQNARAVSALESLALRGE